MSHRVFSVGECPVDPGFGVVLVLGRLDAFGFVFWCPACGCAWESPPRDGRFDRANALRELARGGVRLPTETEVAQLAAKQRKLTAHPGKPTCLRPSARVRIRSDHVSPSEHLDREALEWR
jgi:hypothetical protein